MTKGAYFCTDKYGLTRDDIEILELVAQGKSDQEVADLRGIKLISARARVSRISAAIQPVHVFRWSRAEMIQHAKLYVLSPYRGGQR